MKKIIYFLGLLLLTSSFSYAQDTLLNPQFTISFVPQYLIKNGLRADVELKLNKERQWLLIGPQLYYQEVIDDYWYSENYNKLTGFGLDLHHKFFLSSNIPAHGPYLSYGLVYQNFSINFFDYIWQPYEEEEITYYDYLGMDQEETIHKTGINLVFGYQLHAAERLFIDCYLGMGVRKSFSGKAIKDNFNSSITGYNYSGTLLVFGVRFGAIFE